MSQQNVGYSTLKIGPARCGHGVFTIAMIKRGEEILRFAGPRIAKTDVEDFSRSLQISSDVYLGPSGDIDDFVNHSCVPNSGIKQIGSDFLLVAIKDIQPFSEVTFDYSTTMSDEPWMMACRCQEPWCRRIITRFVDLPWRLRCEYIGKGIVPRHVRDSCLI